MYIWVVKRLGTLVGVIHLENGIRESVSSTAVSECDFSQLWMVILLLWMSSLPLRRVCGGRTRRGESDDGVCRARRMPDSSKSSRIAPVR